MEQSVAVGLTRRTLVQLHSVLEELPMVQRILTGFTLLPAFNPIFYGPDPENDGHSRNSDFAHPPVDQDMSYSTHVVFPLDLERASEPLPPLVVECFRRHKQKSSSCLFSCVGVNNTLAVPLRLLLWQVRAVALERNELESLLFDMGSAPNKKHGELIDK